MKNKRDKTKNKTTFFLISLLIITSTLSSNIIAQNVEQYHNNISSNFYDKGFRYNIQGWVYLHLEGEPYERGYQYGYLASAEIIDTINRWGVWAEKQKNKNLFTPKTSEKWWDTCKFKAVKNFLQKVPEEYQQEMKGMADGIKDRGSKIFGRDMDYEDIIALQFIQDVSYSSFQFFNKRFHPIRGLIQGITDVLSWSLTKNHQGHCNLFIATGSATRDGGIVVAQASVFGLIIAERCNFIVDVQPTDGYRFIMTCPPGSLWSQEDWYQNEKGILLTETELPQGPFNMRGTPKGVRSRTTIQYSENIDEVIKNLNDGNNGLIPNEWLIGDTKTGEIASFQQALFNKPIKRTTNGFYWSCCLPHDVKVLAELIGVPTFILKLTSKIFPKLIPFEIEEDTVVWKDEIPEKFIELSEKYDGEIDTEIAKTIISTYPITKSTTDCKITSSKLMKNMGLVAYMGVSNGSILVPNDEEKENYPGITEFPPSGWVDIYPIISKPDKLNKAESKNFNENKSKLLWTFKTEESENNVNYSQSVIYKGVLYTVSNSGEIYAINIESNKKLWSKNVGENPTEPIVKDDYLIVGTNEGLHTLNTKTGDILWEQKVGRVFSKPTIITNQPNIIGDERKDFILASIAEDKVDGFNVETGHDSSNLIFKFTGPAYFSEVKNNIVHICSENTCYAQDIVTGKIVWKFETDGPITVAPKRSDNNVYVGSWDGNVYALDSGTGNLKWKYGTGWGIDTTPAVSDDMVFVGSNDNNFYALDADNGDLKWFFTCESAIHSSPIVYGDYVFFGSDDGRFYALNKTNGDLAWSFTPGYFMKDDDVNNYITTPILSNPVAENGVVYFSAKGVVYALDAQTYEVAEKTPEERIDTTYELILLILVFMMIAVFLVFLYSRINKSKEDGGGK